MHTSTARQTELFSCNGDRVYVYVYVFTEMPIHYILDAKLQNGVSIKGEVIKFLFAFMQFIQVNMASCL